jgi:hypothetical protein
VRIGLPLEVGLGLRLLGVSLLLRRRLPRLGLLRPSSLVLALADLVELAACVSDEVTAVGRTSIGGVRPGND